jgi:uncharacterized protein
METRPPETHTLQWRPVAASYCSLFRVRATVIFVVLLPLWGFAVGTLPDVMSARSAWLASTGFILIITLNWLLQLFYWAPRLVSRLRYGLREEDIHLEKGLLIWRQTSVSLKRIQHLQVTQGPLERQWQLAKLHLYTAGTQGANVVIPGLPRDEAEHLKAVLMAQINAEPAQDAEVD